MPSTERLRDMLGDGPTESVSAAGPGDAERGDFLRRRVDGPTPRKPANGSLVVGWDRNPPSSAALRYAVGLADLLAAHLHVVHVVELGDAPVDSDAADWDKRLEATLEEEAVAAQELLEDLDASWSYHVAFGTPSVVLTHVADLYHALMVIIGSPRGGVISFLEGVAGASVARRLIGTRKAVPLLLVPVDTQVTDPRDVRP